MVFTEEPKN